MKTVINDSNRQSFVDAVKYQGPVQGHTHCLYKYPARFSPEFARSAIETFTRPGEVILDPFVGGGTSLIEARLSGRHAFGSDISSLAVFLTRTKTVPLKENDLRIIENWFDANASKLNIHRQVQQSIGDMFDGYDRNMPWRMRKLCQQYLEQLDQLPESRQQNFARCILLRCGQWALDCRKRIPSVAEFRETLSTVRTEAVFAMRQYYKQMHEVEKLGVKTAFRCVQQAASELNTASLGAKFQAKAKLILTSPPYPGVHILYHRWNVRGRRESPAPFWLADCLDGHGCAHYSLGTRRQPELNDYFANIKSSFGNLKQFLADDGLIVQVIAFSSPEWQLDAYLNSMYDAGFMELLPRELNIPCNGRLWRNVPGRRWYSMIRDQPPSSKEVVLIHKKRQN
jgi:DNA modification methylase